MYRYIALFVVFCALSQGESARIRNCDCSHILNATVTVPNCSPSNNAPCTLKRGKHSEISISFTPNADIDQLYAHVFGILPMNVLMPYPGFDKTNACTDSGLNCPLKAGKPQTYVVKLFVQKSYPKITLDVLWTLSKKAERGGTEHDHDDEVCVIIPVKVD